MSVLSPRNAPVAMGISAAAADKTPKSTPVNRLPPSVCLLSGSARSHSQQHGCHRAAFHVDSVNIQMKKTEYLPRHPREPQLTFRWAKLDLISVQLDSIIEKDNGAPGIGSVDLDPPLS